MKKQAFVFALLTLGVLLGAQNDVPSDYKVDVAYDDGQVRVSICTGPVDENFLFSQLLLLQNGSADYTAIRMDRITDSNSLSSVSPKILTFGDRRFLVLAIQEHNRGMAAMDAFMQVFELGADSLRPAGVVDDLPLVDIDISSIPPGPDGRLGIRASPVKIPAGDADPGDYRTTFLYYDASKKAFSLERIDAAFATKTVAEPEPFAEEPGETMDVPYCQLNDDRVNLRSGPGTSAAVAKLLPKSALFSVLDRSDAAQTIAGKTDLWYKVLVRGDSSPGWIFGAFILRK
jgi:hypothetical protein